MKQTTSVDGRRIHRIRQSSISEFDMCAERYRLNHYVEQPERDGAALGTACHAAAEACLLHQIEFGEPMDLQDTLLTFEEEWHEQPVDLWPSYGDRKKAGIVGAGKVELWWNEFLPNINPQGVEVAFEKLLFEDDERIVYLTGTADVLEPDTITDWKFPKGDYTREAWRYQRASIQATVYTWALDRPSLTFGVVHGTTKPKASTMVIKRNESHYDWLRYKVRAMCQTIESTPIPFPMRDDGWWCSEKWCDAWALCKGQFDQ